MSLQLNMPGTSPGVEVKTFGFGDLNGLLCIRTKKGDVDVSFDDFLAAAHYLLTNTDIEGEDDPRPAFVEAVKKAEFGPPWNSGSDARRLLIPYPHFPAKGRKASLKRRKSR